jgi:DNA helicase-2/ATP-dependent DNA helicase PcrA
MVKSIYDKINYWRFTMKKYSLKPHSVSDFLQNSLDSEQLNAVLNSKGRSLVVAGPGSGKTRVITFKIAHLISQGVKPENILLVTFTRAASKEMIDRARKASGTSLKGMLSGTFHHICNYFIRKYSKYLDITDNFTILDREDSKDLIKHVRGQLLEDIGKKEAPVLPSAGVLLSIFSYCLNCMVDLEESIVRKNNKFLGVYEHIEEIWKRYTQIKLDHNGLDYDDLLIKTTELFENNPRILNKESERFQWILVDEFQDTNLVQYKLVEMLSSVNKNLIVVGDDAQSIYSFRGARFENVYDFLNKGDANIFKIQNNYRSTPEIVELVNKIVPDSSLEKELKAVRDSGPTPVIAETWDNLEEAAFVAQKIEEHLNDGIPPERIAVLYRSHYHSMELQMELDKRKINYILFSGPKFVETAHVKDILAFLKVIFNPLDQLSWGRLLRLFPGVGTKTSFKIISAIMSAVNDGVEPHTIIDNFESNRYNLDKIVELLKRNDANDRPTNLIEDFYSAFYGDYLDQKYPNARERRLDVERLIDISERYEDIGVLLEDLAVSEKVDIEREEKERSENIVLTTVHQAKGLEWDVVFILAVNPGDFPHAMAIMEGNYDEEERIFYVAVTRCRDFLYIVRQRGGRSKPMMGNKFVFRTGHDFISKIPENIVEKWDIGWDF